jgi:hypothetical protein
MEILSMTIDNSIVKAVSELGGKLKVKSALNPILWLCGIICVPAILTVNLASKPHPSMIYLVWVIISVAIIAFVYLLLADPDRLQSEEFQIRRQTLEMIESKGDGAPMDASCEELISDPYPRALDLNDEGSK